MTFPAGNLQDDLDTLKVDIESRLNQFFIGDSASTEVVNAVAALTRHSLEEAYFVSCVGLSTRIPLSEIYQLSHVYSQNDNHYSLADLFAADRNQIIVAWPGIGKTVLLSYTLITTARTRLLLPLLFLLRIDGSLSALANFITALQRHKSAGRIPSSPLLLLVDGFDEIGFADRAMVARALNSFRALGYGRFYVSSRLYYDTSQIAASSLMVRPFEKDDAVRYASCFLKHAAREGYLSQDINAQDFIDELEQRGLFELVRVPLLLSLACVIRAEPGQNMPTDEIELLDRAIELLNERWDRIRDIKGRETIIGIGPWKRLRLLKRIAFEMSAREAPETFLYSITDRFLKDYGISEVDPYRLLEEIVQLSGLMRRTSGRNYQFMHAAIHDFLAAKFSVESGSFFPNAVATWDARAGYAACLSGEATQSMICSLRHGIDNVAFNDCLANGARFDTAQVAKEIVRLLQRSPVRVVISSKPGKESNAIEVRMSHDFFGNARPNFITALLAAALLERGRNTAVDSRRWLLPS